MTEFVLCCCLFLLLFASPASQASMKATASSTPTLEELFPPVDGRVLFVGDGDTLTVRLDGEARGRIVRLFGIDAPELKQTYGTQARDFTAELVKNMTVLLQIAEVGTYNRLVALVYLPDGRCLNEELIRAGFAWFHHPPVFWTPDDKRFTRHVTNMVALMKEAQSAHRGLWHGSHPLSPLVHRRRKKSGRTTVYVTDQGKSYHRPNCAAVAAGADALSLREARKRGLTPCRTCKPDAIENTAE